MTPMSFTVKLADLRFHLDQTELRSHLGQLLFTERTLWVMVQTSLQTLKTERVTTRRRHWLIEKSEQGSKGKKKQNTLNNIQYMTKTSITSGLKPENVIYYRLHS